MDYTYQAAFPIGETDVQALPVPALTGELLDYYRQAFGFAVEVEEGGAAASLSRDGLRIGLAANGGDPEQASAYLQVSDVRACYERLSALKDELKLDLGQMREDPPEQGRTEPNRVFFLRDPVGLCYCFGEQ